MAMLVVPLMFNLYQEHPFSTGIWSAVIVLMNYMALDEMLEFYE